MYHFFHAKEELRSAKIAALVLAVAFASWGPFVALVSLPEGISLALAAPWLHLASCSLATAFAALLWKKFRMVVCCLASLGFFAGGGWAALPSPAATWTTAASAALPLLLAIREAEIRDRRVVFRLFCGGGSAASVDRRVEREGSWKMSRK